MARMLVKKRAAGRQRGGTRAAYSRATATKMAIAPRSKAKDQKP
jgi:hypothetical protein